MCINKSSFEIFLELYKENTDLFSDCKDEVKTFLNELDELNKSEPETVVEDRIINWLHLPANLKILSAFQTRLSPDVPGTWGAFDSGSSTSANEPSSVAGEMLENSIQTNSEGACNSESLTPTNKSSPVDNDTLKG